MTETKPSKDQPEIERQKVLGKQLYSRLSEIWTDPSTQDDRISSPGLAAILGRSDIVVRTRPQVVGFNQVYFFQVPNESDTVQGLATTFPIAAEMPKGITGIFVYECSSDGNINAYHRTPPYTQSAQEAVEVDFGVIPDFIDLALK